jgi:hypothetical protein
MNRWIIAGILAVSTLFAGFSTGCGNKVGQAPSGQFKGVVVQKDGSLGPPPGVIKQAPAAPHQ